MQGGLSLPHLLSPLLIGRANKDTQSTVYARSTNIHAHTLTYTHTHAHTHTVNAVQRTRFGSCELMPGVMPLVQYLQSVGIPMAVATSSKCV